MYIVHLKRYQTLERLIILYGKVKGKDTLGEGCGGLDGGKFLEWDEQQKFGLYKKDPSWQHRPETDKRKNKEEEDRYTLHAHVPVSTSILNSRKFTVFWLNLGIRLL